MLGLNKDIRKIKMHGIEKLKVGESLKSNGDSNSGFYFFITPTFAY